MVEMKTSNIRPSYTQGKTETNLKITLNTKSCKTSRLRSETGERGDSKDMIFTFCCLQSEALHV
jgi:hypothetical protein